LANIAALFYVHDQVGACQLACLFLSREKKTTNNIITVIVGIRKAKKKHRNGTEIHSRQHKNEYQNKKKMIQDFLYFLLLLLLPISQFQQL
jgi:hypothetical protein